MSQGWVKAGLWADHLFTRASVAYKTLLRGPMRHLACIRVRRGDNSYIELSR